MGGSATDCKKLWGHAQHLTTTKACAAANDEEPEANLDSRQRLAEVILQELTGFVVIHVGGRDTVPHLLRVWDCSA